MLNTYLHKVNMYILEVLHEVLYFFFFFFFGIVRLTSTIYH